MTRITAKDIETVAGNILDRLQRKHYVPQDAVLVVSRAEPSYGISWGVHVIQHIGERDQHGQHRGGHRSIPTVLDRALDGITSSREAWQVLNAVLRTLDYPFDTYPGADTTTER